jgi:hypothetical protein
MLEKTALWFRLLFVWFNLVACDTNIYSSFVPDDSDQARMEKARVQLDEQEYDSALETLGEVERDSNELRLLRVSARLGASGLSMWSILKDIVDGDGFDDSNGSGIDNFFDLLSAGVVGDGDTRPVRLEALTSSIEDLIAAPDQKAPRVKNLSCFLAGILALPNVADATAAIQGTSSSLSALAATVDASSSNPICPDLSSLNANLATISQVQANFALIFAATDGCKLVDFKGTGGNLNAIEQQLAKFNQQADRGCSPTPACGSGAACQALGLGCVYQALTAEGKASLPTDGSVTNCELVQNCLNPSSCF